MICHLFKTTNNGEVVRKNFLRNGVYKGGSTELPHGPATKMCLTLQAVCVIFNS